MRFIWTLRLPGDRSPCTQTTTAQRSAWRQMTWCRSCKMPATASVFCRRCMKACRPHPKTARRPHEDDKETTPNRKGDHFTNYPKRPHGFLCGLIFLPAEYSAGFLTVCAVLAVYLPFLHFLNNALLRKPDFGLRILLKQAICKVVCLYKCKAHRFTKYDGFR